MTDDTFTCPRHAVAFKKSGGGCPKCLLQMAAPVDEMSPSERADEMSGWAEMVLTVPFATLHARIEALAGRPVWTHELADPMAIAQEIRGERAWEGPIGSLHRVAPNKTIIAVELDDEAAR